MISRVFSLAFLIFVSAQGALAQLTHPPLPETGDPSDTLAVLLSVPEDEIDLTWSKLVIDELIDPEADLDTTLPQIEAMAAQVLHFAGENPSAAQKLAYLRAYIYEAGFWNGDQPFTYDFDDPAGMRASHKSLHHYLTTKRGNCINMPFLFLAVAERMGLELNVTTAPRHVFIQFEDPETGEVQHLETTSGALPQRIVWQRQALPMTDRAIEAGMYMQRLTKRQQVVVMAEALLHMTSEQNDQQERLELAVLMLEVFPQFDVLLLHTMDANRQRIRNEIAPFYLHPSEMPASVLADFQTWASAHDAAAERLSSLGWQPAVPNENVILPGQGRPTP